MTANKILLQKFIKKLYQIPKPYYEGIYSLVNRNGSWISRISSEYLVSLVNHNDPTFYYSDYLMFIFPVYSACYNEATGQSYLNISHIITRNAV